LKAIDINFLDVSSTSAETEDHTGIPASRSGQLLRVRVKLDIPVKIHYSVIAGEKLGTLEGNTSKVFLKK